jgi:hypothetical protein
VVRPAFSLFSLTQFSLHAAQFTTIAAAPHCEVDLHSSILSRERFSAAAIAVFFVAAGGLTSPVVFQPACRHVTSHGNNASTSRAQSSCRSDNAVAALEREG